jgi:hypothetical protein
MVDEGQSTGGCFGGQEEDVRRSFEAGFSTHLTKPATREAVVEAIAAATMMRPPKNDTNAQ